jgi:tetratricopeptide (TPR) repeat protein
MNKIKSIILLFLVFVVPFSFFQIFFQNLVQINIVYILTFGVLLLIIISFLQLLVSKKFVFQTSPLDIPVIIFLGAIFLSFLTSATNKMQAFLDPNFGLLMMISLVILYFYVSREVGALRAMPVQAFSLAGFIISSFIIILSLEPTKGIGVIPLDLLIFIGFTFMYSLGSLVHSFSAKEEAPKVVQICILIIVSLALGISFIAFSKQGALFPSFSLSFKAVFQIFKTLPNALLGFGIDNYSSVFNRVKDVGYNQTDLWQFPANIDRSTLFHIIITTGLVGLASFLYFIFSLIKNIKKGFSLMLGFVYLLCILVIFPPSFLTFFLLLFLASQTGKNNKKYIFNLSESFSFYSYVIIIITASVLFGSVIRHLSSLYLADYFFTQSFVGIKENNFNKVYDNQKKALLYDPYLEQYHLGFARTHFALAQNIIDKAASGSASLALTKENKQTLIEAIQVAINEAQISISLNPKKADYWAQLAQIYIIIPKELQTANDTRKNSPQTIAMTFLKKALELDPNNPAYYFQMGQVLFSQKKADQGFKSIKKAAELKPNWADAHYQLGILYAQKNDMKNAVKELEITLQNLDPKTNQKEYDAVKQTLDKIKSPPAQAPMEQQLQ